MITNLSASFPKVYWQPWDSDVEFIPGSILPADSQGKIYAVIVHAFFGSQVLMAEISNRGVCVPSGRLNPGETIDQAAVRETFEETGAYLDSNRRKLIGCYRMIRRSKATDEIVPAKSIFYSACFVAEVTTFDPIPAGSESTGCFLLAPEDVQDHYFMWDDLLASVFSFALSERERLFPVGEVVCL